MALQIAELRTSDSLDELEQQLRNLPRSLEETYIRILEKVDKKHYDHLKLFLKWIAYSARPLSLEELAEVITIDFKALAGPTFNHKRRYVDPKRVLDKCTGLIVLSEGALPFFRM